MVDIVEIPEWDYEEDGKNPDQTRVPLKPHIRCNCGEWSGIGLHHVHADGTVTASFHHATEAELKAMGEAGKRFFPGCGWHVHLKLLGYDQGDFPPEP